MSTLPSHKGSISPGGTRCILPQPLHGPSGCTQGGFYACLRKRQSERARWKLKCKKKSLRVIHCTVAGKDGIFYIIMLSVYLLTNLYVCLFIYPFICLSIYLFFIAYLGLEAQQNLSQIHE